MTTANRFEGYASFAEFIASDAELSIFRRFDRLNARNLLYLQSELLELDTQLAELDAEDYNEQSTDVLLSAKCWESFAARAEEHPREGERMEIVRKSRKVMKEYQEALLLRSNILNLQTPSSRAFGAFSWWFEKMRPFVGYGRNLLREPNDFVALKTSEQDRLSWLLQEFGGRYFPGSRNADSTDVKYYSERVVQRVITGVSIVLAALLLEGAIVALYIVTSPKKRLGLIALFTCVFAGTIGLLTNARRAEMFAATAAYAAVLVVFVSGNLGIG